MFGDVEVQNASATVANDEEAVEQAEGDGRDGEEIHRRDGFPMVTKKGEPALARSRIPRRSFYPARNGSFGDVQTEHEKFAVDPRSSPRGVLGQHLEDQIANFLGYWSSSDGLPDLGDHPPVPTESGAVPTNHGFRRDDEECLFPAGPEPTSQQPEEPVEQIKPWTRMTPFQHGKLLAQCQIIEQEALTRAKEAKDGSQGDPEESKHGEDLYQNVGGEDRSDVIEVIDSKDGWSFGEDAVGSWHNESPCQFHVPPN